MSGATVLLRPMTTADVPDGLRLSRASGWNQREEDWRALLALAPSSFIVAVSAGRVVGTGGSIHYRPAPDWVCMILVDPASRGQGIGTRIMEDVLARLAGAALVGLDATPSGRPVSLKLGFRDARPLVRLEAGGPSAPRDAASPTSGPAAVRPLVAADLPAVLAWDGEAFGAERAAVLRWALVDAPEYAWCVESAGRLDGYCFGRHGDTGEQVGPVVARTSATAGALVSACLGSHARRRFYVDVPRDRPGWLSALAALGFAEQRPFTRMYRGAGREPGRPGQVFAVVGPEFS